MAYKYVYMIGASGLATGYTKIASDGSVTNYTFTYDAAKNHIRTTDVTHPNTFINYTVQNNNAVYDSSVSSLISSGNYTISRTFYANTDNTINNVNFGRAFWAIRLPTSKRRRHSIRRTAYIRLSISIRWTISMGCRKRITLVNGIITENRYYQYN
jgi:hypothetical protein